MSRALFAGELRVMGEASRVEVGGEALSRAAADAQRSVADYVFSTLEERLRREGYLK